MVDTNIIRRTVKSRLLSGRIKLRFFIILLLLFLSVYEKVSAQATDWLWAKAIGGTTSDWGNSIVIDASGNVYTTGNFSGTADFDPGVGTFHLTSAGDNDIFISKLDSSGNFVWAKAMGGTDYEVSYSIALDASGNVYTTGSFSGTVDFDPGADTFHLTSAGSSFISKLDDSGNFAWAKAIVGASFSLALDASGNVYTTGSFSGTVDFDPGIGTFNLTPAGASDIFVSKLNSSGNFIWAKAMGGTDFELGNSIALDASGNVYTTGSFSGTADFDPDSSGTFNLTSAGTSGYIFISKLDSSGNFMWARAMGASAAYEEINVSSLALDASGNAYTTGWFEGTIDFDPDSSGTYNLDSFDGDMFISKLNSSGNFVWAKAMEGLKGDFIALDAPGNVYTTGYFYGTVDFDPGIGTFNLTSAGSLDIFVSKLDSLGNFIWAKAAGGTDFESGYAIALNGSGNLHITGGFYSSSISFDSFTLTNADSIGYSTDIFIARLDNVITGVENVEHYNGIAVYPNPATDHLTIAFENNNKKVAITITTITGKIIYAATAIEPQKIELNTKEFAQGIYLVQIQSADFMEIEKIIVAK